MRKAIRRIFKWLGILLLIHIVGILGWRLLYARDLVDSPYDLDKQEQIINTWDSAMADGILTQEEIAIHYAPQIDQAVNVLLSAGGRGDFITAVNYDGDWSCLNNWENLRTGDLGAVVYYSVQETDTHYYVGYYFYHPRDDAEIWLDRHENDLEGIMLCVPKSAEEFLSPEIMYTQGHGNLYFYFGDGLLDGGKMLAGSIYGGSLTTTYLDKPHLYIAPNGTLYNQGHSVSASGWHFPYWSVGNSGVRYFYGGEAKTPLFWNGPFEDNMCSYDLRPLDELWAFRNGPTMAAACSAPTAPSTAITSARTGPIPVGLAEQDRIRLRRQLPERPGVDVQPGRQRDEPVCQLCGQRLRRLEADLRQGQFARPCEAGGRDPAPPPRRLGVRRK